MFDVHRVRRSLLRGLLLARGAQNWYHRIHESFDALRTLPLNHCRAR